MIKVKFVQLCAAIILCFAAGAIGSFFTTPAIPTWYASLNKPLFNPPNWIFAPVWSTLYFMMGISLYLIWRSSEKKDIRKNGLIYFYVQLFLNTIWSIVFFGMQSPFLAFLIILGMWLTILITIKYFYQISKAASLLLIPYILWVSFAMVLNFFIMILN